MSAEQFVNYLTWLVYGIIFATVMHRAIRRPHRTNIDVALFFATIALVIAINLAIEFGLLPKTRLMDGIVATSFLGLGYLFLRLLDNILEVRPALLRLSFVGWVVISVGMAVYTQPRPGWLVLAYFAYFVVSLVYASVRVARFSLLARGVTQRRMRSVAAGSLFLGLALLMFSFSTSLPALRLLWTILYQTFSLASGISYYLGFATPGALRRAWQEPELTCLPQPGGDAPSASGYPGNHPAPGARRCDGHRCRRGNGGVVGRVEALSGL